MLNNLKAGYVTVSGLAVNFLRPKTFSPSPHHMNVHKGTVIKQLQNSFTFYQTSRASSAKGGTAEMLYLMQERGMGVTKDKEKNTKGILEGQAEMRRCGWYRLRE